jgi:CheY-like chemotaxis protein
MALRWDTFSSKLEPAPANILVVDDEEPIRRMMEKMLLQSGYSILHAGSGDAALPCVSVAAALSVSW